MRLFGVVMSEQNLLFDVDEIEVGFAGQHLEHQHALHQGQSQFVEKVEGDTGYMFARICRQMLLNHGPSVLLVVHTMRVLRRRGRRDLHFAAGAESLCLHVTAAGIDCGAEIPRPDGDSVD